MAASSINNEIRMVIVGKTGVGKSSLGNSLLQRHHFESSTIGMSVTSKCKFAQGNLRDGTQICIVDTPGIFDTRKSNEDATIEIVQCIGLSCPGPHVFLFVLNISRFTKEELDTVNHMVTLFGEDVINHLVIVFTGKESLTFEKLTLTDYLQSVPPELSELVQRCRSRCVTINNRADDAEVQADVDGIINMVRRAIRENGGSYYAGKMYIAAEKTLKEKYRKERELQKRYYDKGELYRAAEEALKEREKMRLIDVEKHRWERELQKRLKAVEQREKELEESATRQAQALKEEMRLIDMEKHRWERELQKRLKAVEQREKELEESATRQAQALKEEMKLIDVEKHRWERELQKRLKAVEQREKELEESATRQAQALTEKEEMKLIDVEKHRGEREPKKRLKAVEQREKELEESATRQAQHFENMRQNLAADIAALRCEMRWSRRMVFLQHCLKWLYMWLLALYQLFRGVL